MKLNSIQCRDYSAGERFFAVLQNCTENDIRAIDPTALIISADDGTAAETYSSYGRLYSIKHLLGDDTYEVEFERVSKTEVLASSIGEKADTAESEPLPDKRTVKKYKVFPVSSHMCCWPLFMRQDRVCAFPSGSTHPDYAAPV